MYSQESQKSHEFLILSNVKNIVYSVLEKRKPISTSYLSPDAQHSLITCYRFRNSRHLGSINTQTTERCMGKTSME